MYFRWMSSYFQKGYKKKLVASDLYEIDENDKSSSVTEKLSRYYAYSVQLFVYCFPKLVIFLSENRRTLNFCTNGFSVLCCLQLCASDL